MNKNKRKTKMMRFVAFLGVVVTMLSVLLIPTYASTYSKTDVPFYNYWDMSAFSVTKNDHKNAYISSCSPADGTFDISVNYQGDMLYYVPWQYTQLKLKDVCPDMRVGETYYISVQSLAEKLYYNEDDLLYITLCNEMWDTNVSWRPGEALVVTQQHLDAYILLYYGKFRSAPNGTYQPNIGDVLSKTLRIWVNKDNSCDFVPHDIANYFGGNSYEDGYNSGKFDGYNSGYEEGEKKGYDIGYDAGHKDFITENLLISQDNLSLFSIHLDKSTDEVIYGGGYTPFNNPVEYPYNGYTFRTSCLAPEYSLPPKGYENTVLLGYQFILIPLQYGQYYEVGDSHFSFSGTDVEVLLHFDVEGKNDLITKKYVLNSHDGIVVNWLEDFGLVEGEKITSMSIIVRSLYPYAENLELQPFAFTFADMSDYSYILGQADGKVQGYVDGKEEGFEEGREFGFDEGYVAGEIDGFGVGHVQGEELGYKKGYSEGKDAGYLSGKQVGYYEGRSDEEKQSGFFSMISAVVDAPIQAFRGLFNFDVLGIDMSSFMLSIITLAVCLTILKMVF